MLIFFTFSYFLIYILVKVLVVLLCVFVILVVVLYSCINLYLVLALGIFVYLK